VANVWSAPGSAPTVQRDARRVLGAAGAGLVLARERVEVARVCGGDDYELAFTAPPRSRAAVEDAARQCGVPVTRIGCIDAEPGLRVVDAQGRPLARRFAGFDHFGG